MTSFSIGVKLAWEIGGYEASNKKTPLIEVDHVMLGILSLEKISDILDRFQEKDLKNLLLEKDMLYSNLVNYGIDITLFRRQLRSSMSLGNGIPSNNVFHRSPECKQMFTNSSRFATRYITINHLFTTIIGMETAYSRNLLIDLRVDLEKLKNDLLFSFYKNN